MLPPLDAPFGALVGAPGGGAFQSFLGAGSVKSGVRTGSHTVGCGVCYSEVVRCGTPKNDKVANFGFIGISSVSTIS